jgi:hypothetical protein
VTNRNRISSISDDIHQEQSAAAQALANLESVFRVSFMVGDFDGAASAMDSADVETFTAFADKLIRLATAGDPSAEGMLEWIEAINSGTRLDTDIDPELEDLIRKMRERFPNRRRKGKADHLQKFHSPDAFAAAFAAFVAAGDFQSAYEAVRDTDDSIRIPVMKRFLKAAKGGDPVAKKNYEWMSHIFNGTTPPGVSQPGPGTSAPPPGSTPPPGSSTPPPGASAPPPGAPPPVAPFGSVLNGTVLSRCAVAWTMHDLDVVTPWSGEQ